MTFNFNDLWRPISSAPIGVDVETKIDDEKGERNHQVMSFDGKLWWAGEIYVYYVPTHWRNIQEASSS